MTNNTKEILFSKEIQKSNDLTIDDLNKYLPAVRKINDLKFENHKTNEGVFYGLSPNGLKKIPEKSIDLIITEPPDFPITEINERRNNFTISEYLDWNRNWINDSYRILKDTGSIYIICDWRLSGMYQSILNQKFNIQTRISWKGKAKEKSSNSPCIDKLYDIWFASKSNNYLFNNTDGVIKSNFWNDIIELRSSKTEKYPKELIKRIIEASSYKLSWVLDPFSRIGDIGVNANDMGRRFIGFEANKDKILLSMKKIDRK
tara:strand:+ start:671 stop:1450 length:780 start_codon:yes stop_codon:yes gene_type:complete